MGMGGMPNLASYPGYMPQTNAGTQNLYGGQGGSGGGGYGNRRNHQKHHQNNNSQNQQNAGSNAYNQAYGSYSNYGGYDVSTAAAGYGGAPRHMTPCACHCAACRAAGHGNKCVVLRMGLLRLFHGEADPVDLVLQHYYHGASGWDTAHFHAGIFIVQYGAAGDVIAAGDKAGRIHLICARTGAKCLCLKGHR